jgi:prepilin-type N-terminal cleavage/methylation domain-containing protein
MSRTARGFTLAEAAVSIAIIGLLATAAMVSLRELCLRVALRAVVARLQILFIQARSDAELLDHNCAIRFTADGTKWTGAVYEDMNGNGVRKDEIALGIDRLVRPPVEICRGSDPIFIGLPSPPVTDPDDGSIMPAAGSPVNFNNSAICSFSPGGNATPGSVYVTDGSHLTAVVRSSGQFARISALYYDPSSKSWKSQL